MPGLFPFWGFMSALSSLKKKITSFYFFLFANNLDDPQREKPGVEINSWCSAGGDTAGSDSQAPVSHRRRSPVLPWVGCHTGWGCAGRSPTSSSSPAVGVIYCSPHQPLLFPRNPGNSHPRWLPFFFLSATLPSPELSPQGKSSLTAEACRNLAALNAYHQPQLKSLTLSATFSFCLLCFF